MSVLRLCAREVATNDEQNRLAELFDVFYERGETRYRTHDNPERIYLFLTLAQGTFPALFTPLVKIQDRIEFFKQGLEGIEFLHKSGIMHRDIKPANLAVKQFDPPNTIIIDFGCATREAFCSDNPGTIPYLAPEVILGSKHDRAIDVFAYGVVGLELFLLRQPVSGSTPRLDAQAAGNLSAGLQFKSVDHSSIEDLLIEMLRWSASERISAADALRHPSLLKSTSGSDVSA